MNDLEKRIKILENENREHRRLIDLLIADIKRHKNDILLLEKKLKREVTILSNRIK